jgi:uncharacterized membrane protein YeaQ/YmgE (transglycosylase-associated protein family)
MPLMVLTLAAGLLLGVLAPVIVPMFAPERDRATWVMSALLGMSGALVGGYIGQHFGWYDTGREAGLLMSVLSSLSILFAYHAFVGRRVSR